MDFDVVILGAGAAGMMAAIEAGKRGRTVLVIDHADAPGEKIRISGGGRCNFTNIHARPENFLSQNPHFCKSALSRFTPRDFIKLVEKHDIPYHEKTLGQLFCDHSAKDIINMLCDEMEAVGVKLWLNTSISSVKHQDDHFVVTIPNGDISAQSVIVATGGLSIPKMGATGIGYDIAKTFGHDIVQTRAGLVPLLFDEHLLALTKPLSGVSVEHGILSHGKTQFREALLLTHRGLSGPSVLQISSYWREGDSITVNLLPNVDLFTIMKEERGKANKTHLHNFLSMHLPRRLAEMIADKSGFNAALTDLSDQKFRAIADAVQKWQIKPTGSEGYRTAEVTLGGVDTKQISSKTMESTKMQGLYFIGEVVDVTGWLGGYNFQWAWASGFVAGQYA